METLILIADEYTLESMIIDAEEKRGCVVVFCASYYDRFTEKQMNLITYHI